MAGYHAEGASMRAYFQDSYNPGYGPVGSRRAEESLSKGAKEGSSSGRWRLWGYHRACFPDSLAFVARKQSFERGRVAKMRDAPCFYCQEVKAAAVAF